MKQRWTNCFNLSFNSEYGVHLCTEGKSINVIACGDGLLCFFSKYTYEHCFIFENFIVGLLADSVMLHDTSYANIGETVELRCPCTSHDPQLLWRGPPHLTVLSVGMEIMTSLGNYDRLELYGNHDNGEFNLKITNFTRSDEGEYRCILNVNGIAVQSSLQVYIRSK
jgi:hypothetical protein